MDPSQLPLSLAHPLGFLFFRNVIYLPIRHRWDTQKTKTWLERKNTTKQRKRRVLLPGNTSTNNPGGGFNRKTRANGLARTKSSGRQSVMVTTKESKVLRSVIQQIQNKIETISTERFFSDLLLSVHFMIQYTEVDLSKRKCIVIYSTLKFYSDNQRPVQEVTMHCRQPLKSQEGRSDSSVAMKREAGRNWCWEW